MRAFVLLGAVLACLAAEGVAEVIELTPAGVSAAACASPRPLRPAPLLVLPAKKSLTRHARRTGHAVGARLVAARVLRALVRLLQAP